MTRGVALVVDHSRGGSGSIMASSQRLWRRRVLLGALGRRRRRGCCYRPRGCPHRYRRLWWVSPLPRPSAPSVSLGATSQLSWSSSRTTPQATTKPAPAWWSSVSRPSSCCSRSSRRASGSLAAPSSSTGRRAFSHNRSFLRHRRSGPGTEATVLVGRPRARRRCVAEPSRTPKSGRPSAGTPDVLRVARAMYDSGEQEPGYALL